MGKVLIIGAGGVGTVVAHKCAQHPEVFEEIVIASRTNATLWPRESERKTSLPTASTPTAWSSS